MGWLRPAVLAAMGVAGCGRFGFDTGARDGGEPDASPCPPGCPWGCTPDTAQYTATAESSTRRERSTSIVKSTWPGVSMMLMRCSG